jgi:hypothetical protein
VPLVVGGIVLALLGAWSMSASSGDDGRKRSESILLGAGIVVLAILLSVRFGPLWLVLGLMGLYRVATRMAGGISRAGSSPRRAESSTGAPKMTREEAHRVLGLEPGASPDRIRDEHRRLIKKVHPDQGGTAYLAMQINEARDVLLGR